MVFFNWATMQMAAKIVYYGPGLCGKTSNLSFIYAKTSPNSRGEMVSLETESDRTLFFDLLPIEVGTIGGFKTRLQLYTVPGQVFYNTTRKLVLKGVDGVVFVADSQRPMREANIESFQSLIVNLKELGLEVDDLPMVVQFNKRDLKNILTVEELQQDLNPAGVYPCFESSAINGDGVFETLKEITKLTLKKLRRRMASPQTSAGRPRPSVTPVRPTSPSGRKPASISAAALARAAEEGVESDVGQSSAPPADPPPPAAAAPPAGPASTADEPFDRPEPDDAPPEPSWEQEPVETAAPQEPPPAEAPPAPPFSRSEESAAVAEPPAAEEAPAAPAGAAASSAQAEPSPATDEHPADEPYQAAEAGEGEGEEIDEVEEAEDEVAVDFDQSAGAAAPAPPPLKRVQVSNQMDILAELDDLRRQATMEAGSRRRGSSAGDLDIDSLLGGGLSNNRELRRKVEKRLNSDIFKRMHGLQIAVRIQDAAGDTIHVLDPVSLLVEDAESLKRLSLQFTVDLENLK